MHYWLKVTLFPITEKRGIYWNLFHFYCQCDSSWKIDWPKDVPSDEFRHKIYLIRNLKIGRMLLIVAIF